MAVARTKQARRKILKKFPVFDHIEYRSLRLMTSIINFLPISFSTWITRRIGDFLFIIMTSRRRVAISNLEIAFGANKSGREKERIAREAFRNIITCFMEFFRLPAFMKIAREHVLFEGMERLDNALAKNNGVILVMSHMGPWEYMGFIPYLKGVPSAILGRPIKNPHLYKWIKDSRKNLKLEYIDKNDGPKAIFSKLKENFLVGIVIDQWAGNAGIWVDFFGRPTSTTTVPAEFAKRTSCALIPAYCVRTTSGNYKICVEEAMYYDKNDPDWVKNTTVKLNGILERQIRDFPEQWLWLHKRWKEDNKFTRIVTQDAVKA